MVLLEGRNNGKFSRYGGSFFNLSKDTIPGSDGIQIESRGSTGVIENIRNYPSPQIRDP